MIGSGYQLTKAFYAEVEQNEAMQMGCKSHHQSLYTWICELRNRTNREILDLPVLYTMQMTFIGSQHTLAKAIDDLAMWGLIEVLMQSKGYGTKVKLAIAFLQKHCNSDANKENVAIAEMQLQCNTTAIQVQTTKTNKTDKTSKTNNPGEFDLFWNHYGKKTGSKSTTLKEWNKLSTDEQRAAYDAVEKYKAYQPDPQYRKDPERYLKHRVWESEFEVAPKTTNQLPGTPHLAAIQSHQNLPANKPYRELV
ncbi:hypothetical protein [Spirosoma radiotolerans]|uniref:Uncharacterized protein n=1 Tax=Spirosoma radiotolerans TaxID=1379870 RepID=A0A0E3ZTG1_9BACT|nr:hypothetical protein [Spirosoma radiotolerans]AKD54018.1 hypothetical protein SD10_02975 [Spirosoma radiotolerans]